jgi:hypothetical protein
MAVEHDADDVRRYIRKIVVVWAASSGVAVPYLAGVALEENILQLVRELGEQDGGGQEPGEALTS